MSLVVGSTVGIDTDTDGDLGIGMEMEMELEMDRSRAVDMVDSGLLADSGRTVGMDPDVNRLEA